MLTATKRDYDLLVCSIIYLPLLTQSLATGPDGLLLVIRKLAVKSSVAAKSISHSFSMRPPRPPWCSGGICCCSQQQQSLQTVLFLIRISDFTLMLREVQLPCSPHPTAAANYTTRRRTPGPVMLTTDTRLHGTLSDFDTAPVGLGISN